MMLKDRDLARGPTTSDSLSRSALPIQAAPAWRSLLRRVRARHPLDITLEPGRPVRVPIEFETVPPSANAQGFLNVYIRPRRDVPEFVLPVLGKSRTC